MAKLRTERGLCSKQSKTEGHKGLSKIKISKSKMVIVFADQLPMFSAYQVQVKFKYESPNLCPHPVQLKQSSGL